MNLKYTIFPSSLFSSFLSSLPFPPICYRAAAVNRAKRRVSLLSSSMSSPLLSSPCSVLQQLLLVQDRAERRGENEEINEKGRRELVDVYCGYLI